MTKAEEFSNRLMAWSQANQRLNEWIERHPVSAEPEEGDREEFVDLRRKAYLSEWNLLSAGARREVWETTIPGWFTEEQRYGLLNLQASVKDLNFSREGLNSGPGGKAGSVTAWWFIPYSLWVGKLPPHPRAASQQIELALGQGLKAFHEKLQPLFMSAFDESLAGMEDFNASKMSIFHAFDAEELRDFPLPSLHFSQWDPESQRAIAFNVNNPSPYRKGCVAFYFQGSDYQSVAMMRDVVHEVALENLRAINGPDIQFGVLQAREQATEAAELLQWDMWAESVTGDALLPGATHREIQMKVFQKNGRPGSIVARYQDMKNEAVLHENLFECQLFEPDMLFDALEVFIDCSRPEIRWSLERIDVPPNRD